MAITVTTDMKYTRAGEGAPSNVLSAHNALIWLFQDGAIAANPTAKVQIDVINTAGGIVFASDVFDAYLLDYSSPVAKFRFDATQIIKHIITNYFYKEMSNDVISPQDYGNEIQVNIVTYDNAVQEDSETIEYFGSHALNQIGDEYGANIPRLMYNDTEEIAHFLGFPNHVFFYNPTDLAAEDSVISFLSKSLQAIEFLYLSSNNMHPDFGITGGVTHNPSLWYYNGKTYGVWMSRGGAGYNLDSRIFALNHETGIMSDSYLCCTGAVDATDPHAYPSVIVADDGHIIVAREELFDDHPTQAHNSAMFMMRSDNAEDESSWVNALAHNANYFSECGVTGGGGEARRLAYPMLAKTINGDLYLWARSGDAQELLRIFQSQDNGVSWDGFGTGETDGLVVMTFPSVSWAYNSQIKHKTDTKLYMIVNPYNNVDKRNRIYFLWSTDGITWRNVDDSWSKNIQTVGSITEAEAETNLKVCGANTPEVFYYQSGFINDAGNPHILVGRSTDDGANYFTSYYYWNGAAWVNNDFNTPDVSMVGATSIIYQKSDDEPVYLMLKNSIGGKNIFTVYSSDDFFVNMAAIQNINPVNSLNYAAMTYNYKDADYLMFVFLYYVGVTYSDIYVYVEDESLRFEDYGTLGLYVHDLNLGLFQLNRQIYQCSVHYDPTDTTLIKTYNLTVFEPCENAVYVRWLTRDGIYMYWAFTPFKVSSVEAQKIGNVINSFDEQALANSRNFPIGYKNSFDKIAVSAATVPIVFLRKLMELFISPAVYLWQGKETPGENLLTEWVNQRYETFDSDGAVIISAIETGADGRAFSAEADDFDVVVGEEIIVILFLTLNGGQLPSLGLVLGSSILVAISNFSQLTEGLNIVTLAVTKTDTARLRISNTAASNFSTGKVIIKRAEVETDWILLEAVEGSHNLREKKKADNFNATLVLPENFTQTLGGFDL